MDDVYMQGDDISFCGEESSEGVLVLRRFLVTIVCELATSIMEGQVDITLDRCHMHAIPLSAKLL